MEASSKSIRDFLRSTKIYSDLSQEKLGRALGLYERLTKTTSVPTGMPGGGGADRGEVLAGYADAVSDAQEWMTIGEKRKQLIHDFIADAPLSDLHHFILFHRYLFHTGWDVLLSMVTQDFGQMSIRKLYYEHVRALEACADWVNKTGNYRKEVLDI